MKIKLFLIIFLFLTSCSENKKEVQEIKLYENIGKYFSHYPRLHNQEPRLKLKYLAFKV